MPLIKVNVSDIGFSIENAIELINVQSVRDFSSSCRVGILKHTPYLANCDYGWVLACIISTLATKDIKIIVKKSRNPFTKAVAWTYGEDIYFNSRKNHTQESILKTICHELVHIADSDDVYTFGHGVGRFANFNQDEKKNCAPMLFSRMFYDYLETNHGE